MKAIKLTKEQQGFLLYMTISLFKEYPHVGDYNFWEIEKSEKVLYWKYDAVSETSGIEINIHWFEFCMTHLARKIYSIKPRIHIKTSLDINQFLVGVMHSKTHPVDYLYGEYKKLFPVA